MAKRKSDDFLTKCTDEDTKVTLKNAGVKLLKGFYELWKKQELCDVIIKTNGESIPAHRAVLVISCDYFRAMFSMGFEESQQQIAEISLDEVTPEAVRAVLCYIYTGNLTVTKNTIQDLVVLTDLLQLADLKLQCCQFMAREISASNCLGVWEFSEKFSCCELETNSLAMVKQRFPVICQMDEFLALTYNRLIKILQFEDLYLGCEGEGTVLKSVFNWLEHHHQERVGHMADIIKFVRLKSVDKEIIEQLMKCSLCEKYPELRQIIETQLVAEGPDNAREAVRYMYVMGGYTQSRTGPLCPRTKRVERFNLDSQHWQTVADLPILASGVHAFEVHGRLICTAFELIHYRSQEQDIEREVRLEGIYEYDILQDRWKDATDYFSPDTIQCLHNCLMNSGSIAVCPKTNKVYTVTDREVNCISVELDDGDIFCKTVEKLPNIQTFVEESHSCHVAVVCDEVLYVFGGEVRVSQSEVYSTASGYKFDPRYNTWLPIRDMLEPRSKCDVVELGGYIYLVGGFNLCRLKSVERYDPITDQWSKVASMAVERSHHKAVVYKNKICAIGGKSYSARNGGGARRTVHTSEIYDPELDQWTMLPTMTQARCLHGAVVF
ncbi:kelch-like protein diablo [Mizuhopecten yessoensis]|uniref:kelch-like protein diablo n=1 Tax=Mizuhopecten yessoensis TaxID=6573 RepID=UPI000B458D76|nr:kelch-like protein diablo [Mizuhopecten yessoensis]